MMGIGMILELIFGFVKGIYLSVLSAWICKGCLFVCLYIRSIWYHNPIKYNKYIAYVWVGDYDTSHQIKKKVSEAL